MLRKLPPSVLALALGTPAYGMMAVGAPLPVAPPPSAPPSAPTPHLPTPAVAAPAAAVVDSGVAPGAPTTHVDSVRPAPARADRARTDSTPARSTALGPMVAATTTASPDSTRVDGSAAAGATPAGLVAPSAGAAGRAVPAARILGVPARGRAPRVRVEVSRAARTLAVLQGRDTLLVAPAAVGSGNTLRYGLRRWRFETPPGRRVVIGKQAAPVWVPPEWHYAELAAANGWTLRQLRADRPVPLGDGARLVVRGTRVGVVERDGAFEALPTDEEIVFGGTLYIPPTSTANRRVPGQLGAYRLDLGDGFLIHGTPNEATVGTASSHGCVRLAGDALAWVFAHVPVGTVVTIR